jgi:hypothetical protein
MLLSILAETGRSLLWLKPQAQIDFCWHKHSVSGLQHLGFRAALQNVPGRSGTWPLGFVAHDLLGFSTCRSLKHIWVLEKIVVHRWALTLEEAERPSATLDLSFT